MAANPALVNTLQNELVPAPFPEEAFVLKRTGVQFELEGVATTSGRWSCTGTLFLSNVRAVFIGDKADPSGLRAFDLPLVYLRNDSLHQPIFFCNNIKGQVWPAVQGGGPGGSLPPHDFKIIFKEGGIGTFWPLYYTLSVRAKNALEEAQAAHRRGPVDANPAPYAEGLVQRAFVDPSDPTTVYLAQPAVPPESRVKQAPKYAANYGEDEAYEPGER
uniref:Uncharacterized protein n=1 Tax=Chlamydomonas leiostraca TaxID=1034604 RepID=A0A7S0RKJ1_9CHLO|mmetsp:Transcript_2493/g.6413  ORF Transcript_2493/g.6413 Transcript_2493/m.6413 type:complete len:217 (+) Transcript_2493:32-682(+)